MINAACRSLATPCFRPTDCRSRRWSAVGLLLLLCLSLQLFPVAAHGGDDQPFDSLGRQLTSAEAESVLTPTSTALTQSTPPTGRWTDLQQEAYQLLAKTVFRILAFDRKLDERCKYGAVRVVIVRGDQEATRLEASGLARELEAYRGKKISGLPYEYQISDHAPESESFEVIFLPSGLPPREVREVLRRVSAAGILCLTTDLSYIKSGAAVAILLGNERPEIVIQKARAIEQGAEFDPRLYAYSTVIVD